ncbi:MAG: sporulation protein YpjB [Sporolactobacillus sp.]
MKMLWIAAWLGLSILFLFSLPPEPQTTSSAALQSASLAELSDRIFDYASADQTLAAKSLLAEFLRQWRKQETNYSQQEEQIIGTAAEQLAIQLNAQNNSRDIINQAITLRLCVDTLHSADGETPLWKELRSQVIEPIQDMQRAVRRHDDRRYQQHLNELLDSYALVYPAMVLGEEGRSVQAVDQQVTHLDDSRSQTVAPAQRLQQLNQLEENFRQLFANQQHFADVKWMMVLVSAVVLLTLSYSSWRKYRSSSFH